MKKILIPTDFSDQSLIAIDTGKQLAKLAGAEIILLNVIEIGKAYLNAAGEEIEPGEDEHQFINKAKVNITMKLEEMCQGIQDVPAFCEVKLGDPYVCINKLIDEQEIDLIIMGSKGASGIKAFLIGSNTEKVVRYTRVPVLTVKEKLDLNAINDIVVAVDPHDNWEHAAVELKAYQSILNARLHILKVNTPAEWKTSRYLKKQLQRFVEQYQLEDVTLNIYDEESFEDGVLFFSSDLDADMICIAAHHKTSLGRILSGHETEDLVNHAKRPLLTFNL